MMLLRARLAEMSVYEGQTRAATVRLSPELAATLALASGAFPKRMMSPIPKHQIETFAASARHAPDA